MSAGGSISAMVASIKNNARPRRKDNYKKYEEDSKFIVKQSTVKSELDSLKSLAKTRKRLINENRAIRKLRIITLSIFFIFSIAFIYYYKDLLI